MTGLLFRTALAMSSTSPRARFKGVVSEGARGRTGPWTGIPRVSGGVSMGPHRAAIPRREALGEGTRATSVPAAERHPVSPARSPSTPRALGTYNRSDISGQIRFASPPRLGSEYRTACRPRFEAPGPPDRGTRKLYVRSSSRLPRGIVQQSSDRSVAFGRGAGTGAGSR